MTAFAFLVCAACLAEIELSPLAGSSAERRDAVTYDVELVVAVTAPYKTQRLRVWLPIPPTDEGQELLTSTLATFPEKVVPRLENEPLFGNRFAYFEFDKPQGAQLVRHRFRIKVWEQRWNLLPERVQPVTDWPASFAPYLRRESQAVVVDDRFDRLLREIVPQRRDPLHDLQGVMSWIDRNLTYDHRRSSLQASSLHGLEQRRGHCSDYHGFCAALGRALGQPTRVVYGLHAFAKSSPSHCKLEAFLPPYGWVSFDLSETQRQAESLRTAADLPEGERDAWVAATHRRLASGFRDNTWFVQTRGTDYDLAPKAATRVPVVRTIYAEADDRPLTDPDPANADQSTFAWMTAHRFEADRQVRYPFTDRDSLRPWRVEKDGTLR